MFGTFYTCSDLYWFIWCNLNQIMNKQSRKATPCVMVNILPIYGKSQSLRFKTYSVPFLSVHTESCDGTNSLLWLSLEWPSGPNEKIVLVSGRCALGHFIKFQASFYRPRCTLGYCWRYIRTSCAIFTQVYCVDLGGCVCTACFMLLRRKYAINHTIHSEMNWRNFIRHFTGSKLHAHICKCLDFPSATEPHCGKSMTCKAPFHTREKQCKKNKLQYSGKSFFSFHFVLIPVSLFFPSKDEYSIAFSWPLGKIFHIRRPYDPDWWLIELLRWFKLSFWPEMLRIITHAMCKKLILCEVRFNP